MPRNFEQNLFKLVFVQKLKNPHKSSILWECSENQSGKVSETLEILIFIIQIFETIQIQSTLRSGLIQETNHSSFLELSPVIIFIYLTNARGIMKNHYKLEKTERSSSNAVKSIKIIKCISIHHIYIYNDK